jgi:CubicO group peptidase (beta-lactamase class C family)
MNRAGRRARRVALAAALLAAIAARSAADSASLDEIVPRLMQEHGVPGLALALVDREGVRIARGFGVADRVSGAPVDPARTRFRVASLSKLVTATAVMTLVDRGEIDLDADVNGYLGGLRVPDDFPEPLTTRHLLTHSAGIGVRFLSYITRHEEERLPLRSYLAERLPSRFAPPGLVFSYSNHGIALAGLAVESVAGEPFEEYAERAIFTPLQMTRTDFGLTAEAMAELATGYTKRSADPVRAPPTFMHARPPGGLVTTAADMARFMRMHLNDGALDGRRVVSPEAIASMHRRHFSHHPGMSGVGIAFLEYERGGRRLIGHDGDTWGYNARLQLAPQAGLGLFLAYTGTDPMKHFADAISEQVLIPLVAASPAEPVSFGPPTPVPASLPGLYRWTRYVRDTAEKAFVSYVFYQLRIRAEPGGTLLLESTPVAVQPPMRFEPAGEHLFREVGGDKLLGYRQDASGQVTHLLVNPTGVLPMAFERVPFLRDATSQAALYLAVALGLLVCALTATRALRRCGPGAARALRLAAALAATDLLFLIVFPPLFGLGWHADFISIPAWLASSPVPRFLLGPPWPALAMLAVPPVSLAAAAVLVPTVARSFGGPPAGPRPGRYVLLGFVALNVPFALLLAEWNLLGFQL